jgi:hypothetical protein
MKGDKMQDEAEVMDLKDLSLDEVLGELKASAELTEHIDKATGNQEKLKERSKEKVPPLKKELATLLTQRALHEVQKKGERYPKVKRIEKVRLRLGKLATEIRGAKTALKGLEKMRVQVGERREQLIERRDFLVEENETGEAAAHFRERIFGRTFKFYVEPQGDFGPGSHQITIEVDKSGGVTGTAKAKNPQPPGSYKIQGTITSAGEVDLHCTAEMAIPGQSVGDYWVKGSISDTGHVDLHCQAHYDWFPPGNLKVYGRCSESAPLVVQSGVSGGPVSFRVFRK